MISDSPTIRALHAEATRIRADHGLPAQKLTEVCCRVAQDWANNAVSIGGRPAHGSGGEKIIYWHSDPEANPLACFDGWMNSPGHRAWLLSTSTECGFGMAQSQDGTYWGGEFNGISPGSPMPAPPNPPVKPKPKLSFWDWLRRLLNR